MNEEQDMRFQHAFEELVAELEGVVRLRADPVSSQEAIRMAKMRLNELENVLRDVHG